MIADWRDFLGFGSMMAIFTCVTGAGLLLILKHVDDIDAGVKRAWMWARRTFTKAGDHQACPQCSRWQLAVHCLSCGRTQALTVTSTLTNDVASKVILANFEDRRRREAFEAYDELDALWEGRH